VDLGTIQYNVEANTADLDKANKAVDSMAEHAQQAGVAVDGMSKKVVDSSKKTAAAADATAKSFGGMRGAAQNLGWQLQDVAVQAQMGTSAFTIFSQQGSQLASSFSPMLGAVIAVGGAIAGVLFQSLMTTNKAMEEMADRAKELTKDMDDFTDAQKRVVAAATGFSIADENKRIAELSKTINEQIEFIDELRASNGKLVAVYGASGRLSYEVANNTSQIGHATRELVALQLEQVEAERNLADLKGEGSKKDKKRLSDSQQIIKSLENEQAKLSLTGAAMAKYLADKSKATDEERALIEMLYVGNEARKEIEEQNKKDAKAREDAAKKAVADEKSRADAIAKSIAELEKQNALFFEQSKYAEILYNIEHGIIRVTEAEKARYLAAAQANDQLEANRNLAASIDSFAKQSEEDRQELDLLIESVNEFGGAWSRTGSIVADSLGTMADALNDYSARMAAIAKHEEKLAKARAKFAGDPKQIEKIGKAEKKIAEEKASATISGYADMAGAASMMFKEQSKGREALNKAEQVFTAIEIGLALKKASANALTAITSAFSAPFPVNFAAGAAMIAIMSGLGVFGGSGGSGPSAASIQEKQGTGTVLGSDDKSESIANAFEEYSDIGLDQLAELRGIREGLLGLTGGINKLSIGVITSGLTEKKFVEFGAQNLGDIIQSGNVSAKESAGFWNIAFKNINRQLQSQIVDIFGFIGETVGASIESLGISAENDVMDFISDIGKVSFKGLSGEEIQSELNAIFSQQADLIAEFVAPAMAEFQQIGEGLFDTLTRVASEMATFKYFTNALGLEFDLTGLSAIEAQQAIAGFSGGMDKLSENLQTYYEEFFTEEERAANQMKLLTAEMKNLGYDAVPTSRDAFRELVDGIDLTTEAGQKQFAGLVALSGVFSDLADSIDELAEKSRSAAMSLLERSVAAEKEIIDAQMSVLNTSLASSRAVFGALESSLKSMMVSSARTQGITRAQAQNRISSMLSSARSGTLPNIDNLNEALAEVSRPSEKLYSTFEDYATDLYKTAAEIRELKDIAGEQVSTDELALTELQKQNQFLDEIVMWGRQQVDILAGVDTSIVSVAQAITNLSGIIGVTYPTAEQQRNIVQIAQSSEQARTDLAASQQATNRAITAQQAQMKDFGDYVKASQIAISDSNLKIQKLLEKFDAIGMPLRDETIEAIVDPIVEAVTP
jgi:hypothetical protein